jgi:7-carboxy-7-deazaguanine synthase
MTTPKTLRITEIFTSLQGETRTVGLPTTFVRLTGCPLRCGYCDTAYAFHGGKTKTLDEILQEVAIFGARYVTVSGGEPLAQKYCLDLLTALCNAGYEVSLETSGAIDISSVDPRVVKVVDIKTPGSKESSKNRFENISFLTRQDQVKFVICDRQDYDWAKEILQTYDLSICSDILFSPSHGQLSNKDLADWIVADKLPVRFQLQLHKYIWGDLPGV